MSHSKPQFRPLTKADAGRCAELEEILFPGDSPWPKEAFEHELIQPRNTYLGATIEGKLVGYAGLSQAGPQAFPEFEVHTIGVDPAYQGHGLGTALLGQLTDIADAAGGPVFLEVRTDNAPAIGLYEKAGFVRLGIRKNYYPQSHADAYTMKREPRPNAALKENA